ncbi:MAG TPA: DUF2254 domain-containing protein [Thermomicrobiales bacterium]|nr:DUF2254 domain-containing protein [Thermomicrobiales bacterium]
MSTQLRSLWETLRESYWFIPAGIVLAMFGLAYVTQMADEEYPVDIAGMLPGVFRGGPDGARAMLSTIAASMMTAASVTFSITIAALASASTQFGSRLLRIFMRDTGSQVVLGTFVGTFIYCLLILRQIPSSTSELQVPQFSTTVALLLALLSIGVLIYFVHHMASMLQVWSVAGEVGESLLEEIRELYPEQVGRELEPSQDAIPIDADGSSVLPDADSAEILARRLGYIQAVDHGRLMRLAVKHDIVVRLDFTPGRFVVPDTRLAMVWPAARATPEVENELQKIFILGSRRTTYQDIELYFDELIEMTLRAMSRAINDPHSAMICIDWLTGALTTIARRQTPSRYRFDNEGRLRVIADAPSIAYLIDLSFDRIRNVSRDHPEMLAKLIDSARIIAQNLRHPEDRAALRRQLMAIDAVVRNAWFAEHERQRLRAAFLDVLDDLNAAELDQPASK